MLETYRKGIEVGITKDVRAVGLEDFLNFGVVVNRDRLLFRDDGTADFTDSNGNIVNSINGDGLKILRPLLSGKNIGDTILELSNQYKNVSRIRIQRETIVFVRKLYSSNLIELSDINGIVEIPAWKMEPITDVHMFITHKCNLRCIHCLIVKEKRKELTTSEFINLVDDFAELGCTHLDITGGETTTKKGFLDIAKHAQSKGISVGLATNGTNWIEEDIRKLIDLHPEKVNISIYSFDPGVHDYITQKSGSFEKSIRFAKKLIQAGIKVNFKCMVMKENFNSFAGISDLAKSMGVGVQFDAHITSKINGDKSPLGHRLSDEQLQRFIKSPYCSFEDRTMVTSDTIVCNAGVDRASVNAYGDISPCAVFPISIGNVKEYSLEEIWRESPILKDIRKMRFKDFGKCGSCALLQQCSPCPGASFLEQGNYRESPEWSCNFTNIAVQIKQKGGELIEKRK